MAGPFAAGGTGAVVPGGQSGETAAWAVLHPSSGPADTPAAASPVDARRFRRVSSGRRMREPGSGVDAVICFAFPVAMGCCVLVLLTPSRAAPRRTSGQRRALRIYLRK